MKQDTCKLIRTIALFIALAVSLVSCEGFFTGSLATWAARGSYTLPADLSAAQRSELLRQALSENDPALASALLPGLLDACADPTSEGYDAAAADLFAAVLLSSGVSDTFTDLVTGLSTGDFEAVLVTMQESAAAITLTQAEIDAFAVIATDPPADIDPNEMMLASMTLIFIASSEVEYADPLNPTPAEIAALEANPVYQLAMDLAAQAAALSAASGVPLLIAIP